MQKEKELSNPKRGNSLKKDKESQNNLKKDILDSAERLFKTQGYDKTTFQMIADELKITKGAISYHFQYKWKIFDELFSDYLKVLHSFIHENLVENHNSYVHYSIIYISFFRQAMSKKENWALLYHNEVIDFLQRENVNLFTTMFYKISNDFHKGLSDEEIKMACSMAVGAVLKLLSDYDKGTYPEIDSDAYCYYCAYLIGTLSRLDEATVKKNLETALGFLEEQDIPKFSLFV